MDKKGKERIALMLIKMAKEVNEYLSSEEKEAHSFYRSISFLMSSFDEERESILINLLNDTTYTMKFSEEFLEKLLKKEMRSMMDELSHREKSRVSPQKIARRSAEAIFNELDNYTTIQTLYLQEAAQKAPVFQAGDEWAFLIWGLGGEAC